VTESSRGATVGDVAEQTLIDHIVTRLPASPDWLVVGPGDDGAVIRPERNALEVITTDACVEGVHFDRRFVPADAIGHRALAANLSDLAAMGAAPRLATLSMAMPESLPLADFEAVIQGFLVLARAHRVAVIGGNLARSPGPFVIDVMALGTARPRRVLTRAGARPGDLVFVSGSLGGARAGLEMCADPSAPEGTGVAPMLAERYRRPPPRVRLGVLLGRNRAATACMDLSDGLADGLRQLARAGGTGIEIDAEALPIDPETRRWFEANGRDPVAEAIAGGDDYELLFTVSPRRQPALRSVARLVGGLSITRIGVVTREPGVRLRRNGCEVSPPETFTHFSIHG
jgi:thiamine-monophosphate kinase